MGEINTFCTNYNPDCTKENPDRTNQVCEVMQMFAGALFRIIKNNNLDK